MRGNEGGPPHEVGGDGIKIIKYCKYYEKSTYPCPYGEIIEFNNLHITANLKLAKDTLKDYCGIYCIKCLETGAMYIGSSVDIGGRLIDHILYNSSSNSNIHLQNAIDATRVLFYFFCGLYERQLLLGSVVEFCTPSDLLQREQHYLDWLFSLASNLRYNFCPTAEVH